jgi:hypothetical protein
MAFMVAGLVFLGAEIGSLFSLFTGPDISAQIEESGGDFMFAATFLFIPILIACVIFAAFLFLNDLFGYADSPVRFDRARRKVYMWASRKEGPLVLDWDSLKVVTQSATAVPVQANAFKSVLLVDEDANGDVRFEGRIPRIAQIGAMSLNREAAMAAYEYVRVFMEDGPQALPPVKKHLVWRPRGWRVFVDIFGILREWVHGYPQAPAADRRPGLLAFATVFLALSSVVFWTMQLGQAVAVRWGNRIPKWPKAFQDLAAIGGPMAPPSGALPTDVPMNTMEKAIGGLWAACGIGTWVFIVWGIWG